MGYYLLYGITVLLTIISFYKDRRKTELALKKAWKAFESILPEFLSVLIFMGIIMAILNPDIIAKVIGSQSGWLGVVVAAAVGAVTLIPAFIAFPMGAMFLQNGAGLMQMAAFVSTLTMVGILTLPLEIRYFGRRLALWRNGLAFAFAFIVAYVIDRVVG